LFRGINYLLNHLVLVVAVIAGLIAFCLADMAIYDIKVQSNNAQVTSNITQYLDKIGIKKFIWKSKIKNNLASDLVENFEQIAHANVKIAGNTLVINVVTAANENSKIKTNFYAKYDAVIKNIITYSGTALVTVGDVVKKGDLLVADAYPDSAVITGEVAFVNDDEISRLEIWII
ncbi:MAG: sporulation protein YqfD, partial [Clostridia bacterium]|nr:sporulation protein YqfD [Clostridia bacterium]